MVRPRIGPGRARVDLEASATISDDDQTNRDPAGAGWSTLHAPAYPNSADVMAGPLTLKVTLVCDQGAWAGIQKVTVRWAAV